MKDIKARKAESLERVAELHRALDETMAWFFVTTGRLPSETTVLDFAVWLAEKKSGLEAQATK